MSKSHDVASSGETASTAAKNIEVWVARALWFVLPLTVGGALGSALDGRSDAVRTLGTLMAWGLWGVTLVAILVPRTVSLTFARVVAPGALAAAAWAAGPGAAADASATSSLVAVISAALTVGVMMSPGFSDAFVDGSSYGVERRFALKVPIPLGVLAALTWVVVAAAVVIGPFLLAVEQWVAGIVATALGGAAAYFGVRSLHGLSRRWLVLVPSGVVVHDPVARPDSVMAPRPLLVRLGPAESDSDAVDLTLGATGLALEIETSEALPVTVRQKGRDLATEATTRVVFTPVRPAAVLDEATARRLPVA